MMHRKSVGNELLTNVEIMMSIHHSQNDCSFHDFVLVLEEVVHNAGLSVANNTIHTSCNITVSTIGGIDYHRQQQISVHYSSQHCKFLIIPQLSSIDGVV